MLIYFYKMSLCILINQYYYLYNVIIIVINKIICDIDNRKGNYLTYEVCMSYAC